MFTCCSNEWGKTWERFPSHVQTRVFCTHHVLAQWRSEETSTETGARARGGEAAARARAARGPPSSVPLLPEGGDHSRDRNFGNHELLDVARGRPGFLRPAAFLLIARDFLRASREFERKLDAFSTFLAVHTSFVVWREDPPHGRSGENQKRKTAKQFFSREEQPVLKNKALDVLGDVRALLKSALRVRRLTFCVSLFFLPSSSKHFVQLRKSLYDEDHVVVVGPPDDSFPLPRRVDDPPSTSYLGAPRYDVEGGSSTSLYPEQDHVEVRLPRKRRVGCIVGQQLRKSLREAQQRCCSLFSREDEDEQSTLLRDLVRLFLDGDFLGGWGRRRGEGAQSTQLQEEPVRPELFPPLPFTGAELLQEQTKVPPSYAELLQNKHAPCSSRGGEIEALRQKLEMKKVYEKAHFVQLNFAALPARSKSTPPTEQSLLLFMSSFSLFPHHCAGRKLTEKCPRW